MLNCFIKFTNIIIIKIILKNQCFFLLLFLVTSAVEKPKNFIINATKITTGYSKYINLYVIILIDTDQKTVDSAASKSMEFPIRRFLEKFRNKMPYGMPELGIPPLDPFELDEIDIVIENPEIGK